MFDPIYIYILLNRLNYTIVPILKSSSQQFKSQGHFIF